MPQEDVFLCSSCPSCKAKSSMKHEPDCSDIQLRIGYQIPPQDQDRESGVTRCRSSACQGGAPGSISSLHFSKDSQREDHTVHKRTVRFINKKTTTMAMSAKTYPVR